jgi:hypothetical protein
MDIASTLLKYVTISLIFLVITTYGGIIFYRAITRSPFWQIFYTFNETVDPVRSIKFGVNIVLVVYVIGLFWQDPNGFPKIPKDTLLILGGTNTVYIIGRLFREFKK